MRKTAKSLGEKIFVGVSKEPVFSCQTLKRIKAQRIGQYSQSKPA
jgi:hypothetical protein